MQQTSQVVRHFSDALLSSRFLSLRLMHIMKNLYDSICIAHGVQPMASINPNLPLKTQCQTMMTAIQDVSKMTSPAAPRHSLAMASNVQPPRMNLCEIPSTAGDANIVSSACIPCIDLTADDPALPQEVSTMNVPIANLRQEEPTDPSQSPRTFPQKMTDAQNRGAFVNAFQQFMNCDDDTDD